MNFSELIKIARNLSTGSAPAPLSFAMEDGQTITISPETMEETLRDELFKLCSTEEGFRRHSLDLCTLIKESVDLNLPPKINKFFNGFAVTRQYGMNDRPVFKVNDRRATVNRGKTFVTLGSSAGVYEVFRLGAQREYTIHFQPIVAAIQVQFEEFINGRLSWNELLAIIEEGMEDRIYEMVVAAMDKVEKSLPAANKGTAATFDEVGRKAFEKVLATVSVYGQPVIFCTELFAREITEGTDWASEEEKKARRNIGYLANYKGARINILPQTFEDETNTVKKVDDSKAYILPGGQDGIINVCFQGPTHARTVENEDWSHELQTYKRVGVAIHSYNDLGTFQLTSLKA